MQIHIQIQIPDRSLLFLTVEQPNLSNHVSDPDPDPDPGSPLFLTVKHPNVSNHVSGSFG